MAFTSIATTGGWSTNTVTAAYDLLFKWQLKAMPLCRQFVDIRPAQPTHRGQSVTLQRNVFYGAADVLAATTPLGEESDVTPTKLPQTETVTLTPAEYGFANVRTLKLANRGMVPIDPVIARAIAVHCGDTVDYLLQSKMRGGTQVQRAAGRASTATVTSTDVYSANMIRKAVTTLRANSAQPRDGVYFTGIVHPNAVHDLRTETGAGNWRDPNVYGQNQSALWAGEFGEYEGVRFIQSPTLFRASDNDGATAANVYRGYILGQEALAEAVITEPHTVLSPQTDLLKRNQGIGWYGDLDFGIYRDKAIVRLEGASSMG